MLLISSLNYPGGDAVSSFYEHIQTTNLADSTGIPTKPLKIHADVLTCMTGLTLFQQNTLGVPVQITPDAPFQWDKTEKDVRLGWPKFWAEFDYVLVEDATLALGQWEVVGWTSGFSGLELLRPGQDVSRSGEEAYTEWKEMGPGTDMTICNGCKEMGLGPKIAALRDWVRKITGGWWFGPKMTPKIRIMKQVKVARAQTE